MNLKRLKRDLRHTFDIRDQFYTKFPEPFDKPEIELLCASVFGYPMRPGTEPPLL